MPDSVDTYAAKTQLSRLLARVEAGEEIVITRRGKPVARLVPAAARPPARLGLLKGRIEVPDDFNDQDDELNALQSTTARSSRRADAPAARHPRGPLAPR